MAGCFPLPERCCAIPASSSPSCFTPIPEAAVAAVPVPLLIPLGGLPLMAGRPGRLLLLAPLLLNLLTQYVYQYDTGFQYSFGITAFLFYAAVLNGAGVIPVCGPGRCWGGPPACCCFRRQ